MPLLYQVFCLSPTSFKIKLYSSMTFVFFQRLQKIALLECQAQTLSPNWFKVPSMQTMRFLLPFSWLHVESSDRGEGSVATLLFATSATYINKRLSFSPHCISGVLTFLFPSRVGAFLLCHRETKRRMAL